MPSPIQEIDSERHYLEQELYNQFQKDDSLFEFLQLGSLDGVWFWDLENPENEWMSPRFWTLLGFDPDEKSHLASEWQDLIHPDDLKTALENFAKHFENPQHPYDQVVRYRHRNGSTVWVRCRGIIIRDDKGVPIRMLGAHTDLTQLKRSEEKLLQKTLELEEANRRLEQSIRGVIPLCTSCKRVRDDAGYWSQVEEFINQRSEGECSHSICPDCVNKL